MIKLFQRGRRVKPSALPKVPERGYAWRHFITGMENPLALYPAKMFQDSGMACLPIEADKWIEDKGKTAVEVFLTENDAQKYIGELKGKILFAIVAQLEYKGIETIRHFREENLTTIIPKEIKVLSSTLIS